MTICALRSLPATRIRWNTAAWTCHTLISTWKRHHFCWSPILLLPEWSCFRAWNIGFVAFDETPWFLEVIFVWHGTMRRWTFRSSDRSSSGADLSGTAWQNIWKHRETLHFYMHLGAWIFSWWKKRFCLPLLSCFVVPCFWNVYSLICKYRFWAFHGFTSDSIWTLLPSGHKQSELCAQRALGKSVSISLVGFPIFFSLVAAPDFDCVVGAAACQGVGIKPADCVYSIGVSW